MIQSILGPLRLDATARGLDLVATLDERIDEVAVRAMRPIGSDLGFVQGDGVLMGDEIRIRQGAFLFVLVVMSGRCLMATSRSH